jgi:hypothetical protein
MKELTNFRKFLAEGVEEKKVNEIADTTLGEVARDVFDIVVSQMPANSTQDQEDIIDAVYGVVDQYLAGFPDHQAVSRSDKNQMAQMAMKKLNSFGEYLSENQNYVVNSDGDFMLDKDEVEKFFKSKGYEDEMIKDMFGEFNFQEDLLGIVSAFAEGAELDQDEIENLLIQAANFYEGNY